jgi:hypothetical protein
MSDKPPVQRSAGAFSWEGEKKMSTFRSLSVAALLAGAALINEAEPASAAAIITFFSNDQTGWASAAGSFQTEDFSTTEATP